MQRAGKLQVGTRLGPYSLGEPLGSGGFATVYLADDPQGRTRAVKVAPSTDMAGNRRFLREFESLRLLRVQGVVPVYEAGFERELMWFSMDRIFGQPFHHDLHQLDYVPDRVTGLIARATRLMHTLAALHEAGFAHRDLKPGNVLVDAGGGVHVLDFGVSRFFADEGDGSTDLLLGTVPYMAPEQVAALPSGPEVDVYSAGLLFHEAIDGVPAPPANPIGWLTRTCLEMRPPLATRYREVPLALSHLIERMTAIEPTERPTSGAVAEALERIADGVHGVEWPTPRFVSPGSWADPVEELLEGNEYAIILEGAAGSGRARLAEKVQRLGLLARTWTLPAKCRADRLGWPIQQWLRRLCRQLRPEQLDALITAEHFTPLAMLWPDMPLARTRDTDTIGDPHSQARAASAILTRLAQTRPVLLVVHQLEQVDWLTAAVLTQLGPTGPRVLMLHEPRWATRRSRALVKALVASGARSVPMQAHHEGDAIAESLCPAEPTRVAAKATAQQATEAGWIALAHWRGVRFQLPVHGTEALAPLANPVPIAVLRHLCGPNAEGWPWVRRIRGGATLDGSTARSMATARLTNLVSAATAAAKAWQGLLADRAPAAEMSRLWCLAEDFPNASHTAALAAIEADRVGQYREAREWLLLTESLGVEPTDALLFDLAYVKARVALRTDALSARHELLQAVDQAATTASNRLRTRTLEAEYALRDGQTRGGLAAALHVSANAGVEPRVATRALLVAIGARLQLGDLDGAERDLARARTIMLPAKHPTLVCQADNWEAEIAWQRRDLDRCHTLCQRNQLQAARIGYVRGEAFARARLSAVLRQQGERFTAEATARRAVAAFAETGDIFADASARLALATLEAERGELVRSRRRLDHALRNIRGLHLDHLLPAAMCGLLRLATAQGNPTDAALALAELGPHPTAEEAPAAVVRWWRSRGDLGRAMEVDGPQGVFGRALWHIERARAQLSSGGLRRARHEARKAHKVATSAQLEELALYAELVFLGLSAAPGEHWETLRHKASRSPWVDLSLMALELEARQTHAHSPQASIPMWKALAARASELGYRAEAQDAEAWLSRL